MAANDFKPYSDGRGGHAVIRYARLNAAESFREGEVVVVNSDGELAEGPVDDTQLLIDDADTGVLGGVAAGSGDTTGTGINPATGNVWAAGDLVPYYPWNYGTLFSTTKIRDTGAIDTQIIPTGTMVGSSAQITGTNLAGEWVVETGIEGVEGTDVVAHIVAVTDSLGRIISATDTTTGVNLIFEITAKESA